METFAQDSVTCGMTTRGPIPIHGMDGLVLGVVLGVGAIHGMNGLVAAVQEATVSQGEMSAKLQASVWRQARGMLLIPTLPSYCHQRKCGDQPRFRRD